MMKTEMILETSVSFIHLTRLIAREDFIGTGNKLTNNFAALVTIGRGLDASCGPPVVLRCLTY
jgi:hypothetical protein